jgi:hypothetical protein
MESVSGGLTHPGLRHSRINETVSDKRRVGDLRRQPIADRVHLRRDSGTEIRITAVAVDAAPLDHQRAPSARWRAGRGTLRLSGLKGRQWGSAGRVRMKTRVANPNEKICPASDGAGVLPAIQPVQPGRRIYPPPCKDCGGKGRIPRTDN